MWREMSASRSTGRSGVKASNTCRALAVTEQLPVGARRCMRTSLSGPRPLHCGLGHVTEKLGRSLTAVNALVNITVPLSDAVQCGAIAADARSINAAGSSAPSPPDP
nr:hypothetical protein StreXyl84_00410 [Streptomyces sp. Xyl84]